MDTRRTVCSSDERRIEVWGVKHVTISYVINTIIKQNFHFFYVTFKFWAAANAAPT